MKLRYSQSEQEDFRKWLESWDRPRNLEPIQIFNVIDIKTNNHLPVKIDEQGRLYVNDEVVLINKKVIPVLRHNISWGLSHTPFRLIYGLPNPYSSYEYVIPPVDVHDLEEIHRLRLSGKDCAIAYWFSYVLQQREELRNYIALNGRRLRWVGSWADQSTQKSFLLFPGKYN